MAAQSLNMSSLKNWTELKEHLQQNFSDTRSEHTLMYEASHYKQTKENILD